MTPEQQAIHQHLSKDRPASIACCCVGPQLKDPSRGRSAASQREAEYLVHVTDFGNTAVKVMKVLHQAANGRMSLFDINQARKEGEIVLSFDYKYNATDVQRKLEAVGATVELVVDEPAREPFCPCGMRWVEIVNNTYYRIDEQRSPNGVTHTAKLVGPIDGPYVID